MNPAFDLQYETLRRAMPVAPASLLAVDSLQTGYGGRAAVFGVDLQVETGEIVALLGHNGAGKTAVLKGVFGLLPVLGGSVWFDRHLVGNPVTNVRRGMMFIPSETAVFPGMSVLDNLKLGGITVAAEE